MRDRLELRSSVVHPAVAGDPGDHASPAGVYLAVFRAGAEGVCLARMAGDPDALARVAAAFRAAETQAGAWLQRRLGWDRSRARELVLAFALELGMRLIDGGVPDYDALQQDLEQIWSVRACP